jgi:hypothetical protein
VRDTPGLQEHDWLEWKSGYNLEKKSGRAAIAKHLIGFANRDPDAAARCLNGHGCLLLGVEPGVCPGMPDHDSADLENWLRPFVGEKVVFDVHLSRSVKSPPTPRRTTRTSCSAAPASTPGRRTSATAEQKAIG